jgi:hypothetical protein
LRVNDANDASDAAYDRFQLRQLESRVPYLASLGIGALHLRDVTRKQNVTSGGVSEMYLPTEMMISAAQETLGGGSAYGSDSATPLRTLTRAMRSENMTLMVQARF